ncbi:DUF2065 domain-containing protein [Oryzibacter oryziterrae]|uniref:DUF2065 domain-containing protein n=1 Tax=Oryzibacter oryziterrae TaxID=2766474 RepID=UPI001F296732|nr:DUF2065 domain-containing protein [Oryzibacter oryziterrae]
MNEFVIALGLVAVMEGLLYAAAPFLMRKAVQHISELSDTVLRIGGVVAMAVGVLIVWLAKSG